MNNLGIIAEIIVSILIVLGASFVLIGSWGLVRLPTLMERLHGPTKATTLGLGGMLVASIIFFRVEQGVWTMHELLISLFLFITAPVAANMIAKVHLHALSSAGTKRTEYRAGDLPSPPGKANWATYERPHPETAASTSEN